MTRWFRTRAERRSDLAAQLAVDIVRLNAEIVAGERKLRECELDQARLTAQVAQVKQVSVERLDRIEALEATVESCHGEIDQLDEDLREARKTIAGLSRDVNTLGTESGHVDEHLGGGR